MEKGFLFYLVSEQTMQFPMIAKDLEYLLLLNVLLVIVLIANTHFHVVCPL